AAETDAADAPVALVDVDPDSPRLGTRYPVRARFLAGLSLLVVAARPGAVLPKGVRHAFVVTRGALDAEGVPVGASAELARIRGLAAADRQSPAERLHGEALDRLPGLDVAGLAVFTTATTADELHALRARVAGSELPAPAARITAEGAAPYGVRAFGERTTPDLDAWLGTPSLDDRGLPAPGGDDPGGIAHDAISGVLTFAVTVPSFLDPATGHFERESDGTFRVFDPALPVPVTLAVPRAPAPPSGYPVVVHGHGLSNDRGSLLSTANELCRRGYAVIGLDDVQHGARAGLPDLTSRFPGAYRGPDGIPDTLPFPVGFFGAFQDFRVPRDSFRQTALDQVSLLRWLRAGAPDLAELAATAGIASPRFDPARLHWSGGSLGGIVGGLVASLEPDLRAAALHVPGAAFLPFVVGASAELAPLIGVVTDATFGPLGGEPLDELHPLGILLSQITEPGDPIAFVDALHPESSGGPRPHVLVTYAADDEVLPNLATFALLRAAGIPVAGDTLVPREALDRVAAPARGNAQGRTMAAVEYAPANHALGYERTDLRRFAPGHPGSDPAARFPALPAPIEVPSPLQQHLDQLLGFLDGAADGAPEIRVTAPVRADFDGDGALDADERAAGTDPWDPASRP
ncbi:MAG: hypothetical protein FJ104_09050, partial [Deltaproteobacteria bacterium]|nr:hypothetical protein [Deltaproteobacteria bacterium]